MPNRIPKDRFARTSATADQRHIHLSIERTKSTRLAHESIYAHTDQQTAASPTNSGIRSAIDSKESNTLHPMNDRIQRQHFTGNHQRSTPEHSLQCFRVKQGKLIF
jgi:hypothetical protein